MLTIKKIELVLLIHGARFTLQHLFLHWSVHGFNLDGLSLVINNLLSQPFQVLDDAAARALYLWACHVCCTMHAAA